MGVLTTLDERKTAIAPRSSPKLEPPTMIWEYADTSNTGRAIAGIIAPSRYLKQLEQAAIRRIPMSIQGDGVTAPKPN